MELFIGGVFTSADIIVDRIVKMTRKLRLATIPSRKIDQLLLNEKKNIHIVECNARIRCLKLTIACEISLFTMFARTVYVAARSSKKVKIVTTNDA